LFQQSFNFVKVIQGIIQEKLKFGDRAQLVADSIPEFMPDVAGIFLEDFLEVFLSRGRENAQKDTCLSEIGCDPNRGNGDHFPGKHQVSLPLEEISEFPLYQPGYFILSRCGHNAIICE
jgi:hypothetical protein